MTHATSWARANTLPGTVRPPGRSSAKAFAGALGKGTADKEMARLQSMAKDPSNTSASVHAGKAALGAWKQAGFGYTTRGWWVHNRPA